MSVLGNLSLTFVNDHGINYHQMNKTPDQLLPGRTMHKHDKLTLVVLILVACVLGIYLISSTVLISKDGFLYIEQAKMLERDPAGVLKGNTPGYPMLLFAAHKLVGLLADNSSLYGWIYTSQGVTLLCRLLALIPLYLIGKRLVGDRNSFYAILILILLPYPAHMSCELTREWPYAFFWTTGFLLLLSASDSPGCRLFGAVGVAAGLAHIIRPEGAQLVVFGVLWLLPKLAKPGRDPNRAKAIIALAALLIGFSLPAAPYAIARGRILPDKFRELLSTAREMPSEAARPAVSDSRSGGFSSADLFGGIGEGLYEIAERISENLLYFFVPPMLIGFYLHFRSRWTVDAAARFFVGVFIAFNVVTLILLHRNYGYMSRRHVLPIVLIAVFYVPSGLRAIADSIENKRLTARPLGGRNSRRWFLILLTIGLAICMPKLLRPEGADKQGYRDAAEWLRKNTADRDVIAVPDPRISFYAERKGLVYETDVPGGVDYAVVLLQDSTQAAGPAGAGREMYAVRVNGEKKNGKKLVIYEMM